MNILSKEITNTHTNLIVDLGDGFIETSSTAHAVEWEAPLSTKEIVDGLEHYSNIIKQVESGIKISYLRHYHEYFEAIKFNRTNTSEQQSQADIIYSALLDYDI